MNHPQREEWAPYIYGESNPDVRRKLREHLAECGQCRQELETLKQTAGRLDAWKIAPARPLTLPVMPVLKWAAIVCAILVAGFAAGRVSARPNSAQLRAELLPELRRELRTDMAQLVRSEIDKASAATLSAAADHADAVASACAQTLYRHLKQDVDTLALNADAGLRRTEQQLGQLAGYHPNLPDAVQTQQ